MTHDFQGYNLETSKRWALLIGVSSYAPSSGFPALPHSRADVEAMARVLRSGPTPYELHRLADDSDPTLKPERNNILVEVRRLARQAGPEDIIILYFSGHGLLAEGDTYLVPSDGRRELPELTMIPVDWLRQELASSRAAVRVLILDACHAGPPGKSVGHTADVFRDKLEFPASGFALLASSRHHEVSQVWEEKGLSVFTYFLVRGLEGDAADNGIVLLGKLFRFVSDQVQNWNWQHGQSQTPVLVQDVNGGEIAFRAVSLEAGKAEPKPSRHSARRPQPYRFLAPFTEADDGRFFGRDQAVKQLLELVLYNHHVLLTAPSGTGKTSLLRAGLTAALLDAGADVFYVDCLEDPIDRLVSMLEEGLPANDPGVGPHPSTAEKGSRPAPSAPPDALAKAVSARVRHTRRRSILIFDQLERFLLEASPQAGSGEARLIGALTALEDLAPWRSTEAEVAYTVILSIRQDFLHPLLHNVRRRLEIMPHQEFTLEPLSRSDAEAAIVAPLEGRDFAFDRALLDRMLDDLEVAGRAYRRAHGQRTESVIFPPHLQILCFSLYRAANGTAGLTQYEKLGRLHGILTSHLEYVLDEKLTSAETRAASDLLRALVGPGNVRRTVPVEELTRTLKHRHGAQAARQAIAVLEEYRLLAVVQVDQQRCFELPHDFLVELIGSRIDASDARRRLALELFKTFLDRRSHGDLDPIDLKSARLILEYPDLLEELVAIRGEERRKDLEAAWDAVKASRRRHLRSRWLAILSASTLVLALLIVWYSGFQTRLTAASDRGRFVLSLTPFDLDPRTRSPVKVPASELPELSWSLYEPDPDDPYAPDDAGPSDKLSRKPLAAVGERSLERLEEVDAPGGAYFLKIEGRGRHGEGCAPSWIYLRRTPGYSERDLSPLRKLELVFPTCQASAAGMVEIPGGPFIHGGRGDPPAPDDIKSYPEKQEDLAEFSIDGTEVTNGAYRIYAGMAEFTGRQMPAYPDVPFYTRAAEDSHPLAGVDWYEARDYCRFMGKELPKELEWEKAARGGLTLDAAGLVPNPLPRRGMPWGTAPLAGQANLDAGDPWGTSAPVGAFLQDVSPYNILDLAGNVGEWLEDTSPEVSNPQYRSVRGGSWTDPADAATYTIAFHSFRSARYIDFATGMRCVVRPTR